MPQHPLSGAAEQVHGAEESIAFLQPSALLAAPRRLSWPGKYIHQNNFIYLLCYFLSSAWVINNDQEETSIAEPSPWLGLGTAFAPAGGCPKGWAVLGGSKGGPGELGERGIFIVFQFLGGVVALSIAARGRLEGV